MTDLKKARKRIVSVRTAFFFNLLLGFLIGSLLFAVVRIVGYNSVETHYTSEEKKHERELNLARELQAYVTSNELSSDDIERLADWVGANSHLYVMLYKDEQLIFDTGSLEDKKEEETPTTPGEEIEGGEGTLGEDKKENGENEDEPSGSGGITVTYPTREELIKYAKESGSHLIETSDGPIFAYMTDYSEYVYYDIINIASVILLVLAVFFVVLIFFNRMTARITKLAADVSVVAEGDMRHNIRTDRRGDEIAHLGLNVENMRSSIVANVERIKEAQDANTELITAMSHDIRTPLTVLMGYIDLMKEQACDPTMTEYVRAAEKTTERLKKMSDDMFNYFLVFSGENVKIDIEEYDAYTLFEQMLAEHIILLKENGFLIEAEDDYTALLDGVTVRTDAAQLMRIFENLFSNLLKYADKHRPVSIKFELYEGKLKVIVANFVSENKDKRESNGIGIRSCKKIAEMLSHEFDTGERDGVFIVALSMKANDN